jgi:uncharacterized membrane protein (UPF0127 family)
MNFIVRNKKGITISLFLLLLILISAVSVKQKRIKDIKDIPEISLCGMYNKTDIEIGGKIIHADIADTECKKELGLSGRKLLGNDDGMIFIFTANDYYGFWMKGMNFPLDIVWINSDFVITGIEKNLQPSTYSEIFGKKYLAQYVLELPSGITSKNNIKVGDKIIFSEKTL